MYACRISSERSPLEGGSHMPTTLGTFYSGMNCVIAISFAHSS